MSIEQQNEKRAEVHEGGRILRVYNILDRDGASHRVEFGIASDAEKLAVGRLRFDIYKEQEYFLNPPESFDEDPDFGLDGLDDSSVLFVARDEEGHIIASARVVKAADTDKLPIEKSFWFEPPAELRGVPRERIAEIGKLVSRTPKWMRTGELVSTIGLVDAIRRYSKEQDLDYGYSFIKARLLGRLDERLDPSPFNVIHDAVIIYPKNGPLAGYFHSDEKNRPEATWYKRTEVAIALKEAKQRLKLFGIAEEGGEGNEDEEG